MNHNHPGPLARVEGDLVAVHCHRCGYAHLSPLPAAETQAAQWRDLYTDEDAYLYEQEPDDWWYWRRVYDERLRWFDSKVPTGGRLLDYGAGLGHFVERAVDRGFEAFGYEPHRQARHGSKYEIYPCMPSYGRFEAAHCALVLEHVTDPRAALWQIKKRMRRGGVLCLIVPNEFNPLQSRLVIRYNYKFLYPHHVNYFTRESLCKLAEGCGFEFMFGLGTFPIEWFALHGLNYVRRPELGRRAHWLRMVFESALMDYRPDALLRLRQRWYEAGIGREVEMWFRKV